MFDCFFFFRNFRFSLINTKKKLDWCCVTIEIEKLWSWTFNNELLHIVLTLKNTFNLSLKSWHLNVMGSTRGGEMTLFWSSRTCDSCTGARASSYRVLLAYVLGTSNRGSNKGRAVQVLPSLWPDSRGNAEWETVWVWVNIVENWRQQLPCCLQWWHSVQVNCTTPW